MKTTLRLVPTLVALLLASCAVSSPGTPALTRFEYEEPQMGMPFRIVVYAPDQSAANAAAAAAYQRIKQLNDIMTDYDADSELGLLSRSSGQGREVVVSEDLWTVLRRAQDLAERSHGAFDVTVGPYVNLWRKARRDRELPDPARLARARKSVGYWNVRLDPRRHAVELLVPEMRLDLGGIAKGYAADEALKVLRQHGLGRALVSAGGDTVAGDPPPGRKAWRIALAPLDVTNAPPVSHVLLTRAAIATSGDLFQRLEIGGRRYSHIVDPHSRIGLTDHALVNVIAPDGMTADSLTKVVSVLGPKPGLNFIKATSRAAVRIVRKPGVTLEVIESARFPRFYDRSGS